MQVRNTSNPIVHYSLGTPFFIEVKKPGGTLSVEQHQLLEKAKELGAITCVAVSVECVQKALGI
jgi:hypothetical protein